MDVSLLNIADELKEWELQLEDEVKEYISKKKSFFIEDFKNKIAVSEED